MAAGLHDDALVFKNASERSLIVSRIFAAPRALVFDAFTDPGHLARWWGPKGFSITTSVFDFSEGGVWHLVMHGPDGRDYDNRITFDEIVPPEKIAFHHGGGDGAPVHHTTTITFEDLGGRTRLTLAMGFPEQEVYERVLRENKADTGATETLGRLGEYLDADRFVVSRRLKAPRDLVWKMYTEIEHLKHWWGPKGFNWIGGTIDFKPGGIFHYGMKSPKGEEMWGRFIFQDIQPVERFSFVLSFSDPSGGVTRAPFFADWPLEVFNTVSFTEDGEGTLVTMEGAPIHAPENERERYRSWHPSMQAGFGASFEQLAAYLEGLAG